MSYQIYVTVYVTAACSHPGCESVMGDPPPNAMLSGCRGELLSFAVTDAIAARGERTGWRKHHDPNTRSMGWYCPKHAMGMEVKRA